jgi:hypothetical protein
MGPQYATDDALVRVILRVNISVIRTILFLVRVILRVNISVIRTILF